MGNSDVDFDSSSFHVIREFIWSGRIEDDSGTVLTAWECGAGPYLQSIITPEIFLSAELMLQYRDKSINDNRLRARSGNARASA